LGFLEALKSKIFNKKLKYAQFSVFLGVLVFKKCETKDYEKHHILSLFETSSPKKYLNLRKYQLLGVFSFQKLNH
jgi:hypothetical protein